MAISGPPLSIYTSSYLSASDTNSSRQKEKPQNLNTLDSDTQSNDPTEFILRGELLDDVKRYKSFEGKKDQTIDPANQTAINNYEINSQVSNDSLIAQQQGRILDAYA